MLDSFKKQSCLKKQSGKRILIVPACLCGCVCGCVCVCVCVCVWIPDGSDLECAKNMQNNRTHVRPRSKMDSSLHLVPGRLQAAHCSWGVLGGGTFQDGKRQRINLPQPQACVCVRVCPVSPTYIHVCVPVCRVCH